MAATYRLTFDADGHPTRIKDDFAAAGPPTVDDDTASGGWSTGSLWYVPTIDALYLCESAATGAADWALVTGGGPSGGAPTDATYLVGTASEELTDEIVVGAAPGGELGGTWAAPTVDTTHAGSSHTDAQAAAEATAAGALAAHVGGADAHHARYSDAEAMAAVGPHYAPDWGEVTDIAAEPFGATASAGVLDEEARADHRHATPPDPVPAHAADADAHHAWPLTEPDVPATIARHSEVTAAIGAHAGTADAHHTRYTDAEADARAAAAVATHEGLADPHPSYVQEAATPGGELGGTYAAPTVDAVHAGSSHAATQAAAEATAAGALASHAGDADAHHDEDHASRHTAGGADLLKLDDLAAPDDTTDLDASTGTHGLLPKLSGSASEYLRGDGSWGAGAGGVTDHGALTGLTDDDHGQYLLADGSRSLSGPWTPGDEIDMQGASFRVHGAEVLPANLPARALAASVDGSGSLVALYVGVDAANPRKRVLLQGDTPDEPVVHIYTASTTWSKPTADTFSHIVVEVQGGGGGGGGVAGTGANESSVSAGGGGGGYARKLIAAGSLTGSYTVTVGAGGSRGVAGNNNGSGGGASSFAGSGITTVQGNGGGGGEGDGGGTGFNIHDGGDGGGASGGDVNRAGDGGGNAVRTSFAGVTGSRPSYHAHGGGSALGGMRRQPDIDVAGADGRSYGGGGTGCSLNASTSAKAGGDGAAGVVIVTEYYMGVAA